MPSITINEIDNTVVSNTMSNEPVTFILGTTTFGPSEYKLLTSMADLNIYGGNVEGTYSFDYVQRILQLGYPVQFYNVANEVTKIVDDKPVIAGKKAKYEGLYPSTRTFPENYTDLEIPISTFNYAYKLDEGASGVTTSYNSIDKLIEMTGEFILTAPEGSELGEVKGELFVDSTRVAEVTATKALVEDNTYTCNMSFDNNAVLDNLVPRPEFKAVFSYETKTIPQQEGEESESTWNTLFTVLFAEVTITGGATVTAKYNGTYGNNISVKMDKVTLVDGTNKYIFSVYVNNVNVETFDLGTEFDVIKDIIENIDSNYIEVTNWVVDEDKVDEEIHLLSDGEDAELNDIQAYITNNCASILEDLKDKYSYTIDFVTFAGITDSATGTDNTIRNAIKEFCGGTNGRKDCFGVLDIPKGMSVDDLVNGTYLGNVQYLDTKDSYVAYYYPYCYGYNAKSETKWLPGSYWFLTKILENARNGGNLYDPPAGVKRMSLTNVIKPEYEIGGVLMDKLLDANKKYAVNPIMNIRNYGYTVFGLRTNYTLTPPSSTQVKSALQQPQIRIIADLIKHRIFDVALGLTFDNNNLLTWNAFTTGVESLLSSMKTNNALNDYEIVMNEELQTEDRKTIYGVIRVSVFEAVEDFVIDFQLDPSTVTYNETTVSL